MHSSLLYSIGLSIVVASLLGYLARLIRQPLILGYIAAGVLIGPQGFRLIENQEEVAVLSELGLAFLLFIVGLEIDVKKFRSSGTASVVIGTLQVVLCSVLGVGAALWLGFADRDALYIGVALSFSSTMIVVKLLSDRKELDTLPGRVSLGILLVQDVLAIVVLAAQSNIDDLSVGPLLVSLAMGLGLIAVSFLASRFVLPVAFRRVAQNPELMLVLSISWCFVMCWLALEAEFSIVMGALIAGVSISTFPYSHDVIVKIRSLRDFFVTLFFVSLGMQLIVGSGSLLLAGALLSVFIILSRFATIFTFAYLLRLGTRVGILSSIFLAQSSEFSLVIATLGLGYGHISAEVVSLVAITLVITSTVSTYLILGGHTIARAGVGFFERLGLRSSRHQAAVGAEALGGETLLLGCHRLGSALVEDLADTDRNLRVLDFNPEVLTKLKERGVPASYVDLSHFDTLEEAGIEHARTIIVTVPDEYLRGTTNLGILRYLRSRGVRSSVIVQANSARDALMLYEAGADYVLLPALVSSAHVLMAIEKAEYGDLKTLREVEIEILKRRNEVLS
jgi:Kef-type K+ transport system membrane component KefB